MIIAVLAAAALISAPVLLVASGEPQSQTVRVSAADLADMQCISVTSDMTSGSSEAEKISFGMSVSYFMGKIEGRGTLTRWDQVLTSYRLGLSAEAREKLVEDHGVRCALEALRPSMGIAQMTVQDALASMAAKSD